MRNDNDLFAEMSEEAEFPDSLDVVDTPAMPAGFLIGARAFSPAAWLAVPANKEEERSDDVTS